jgi:phosphoribosylformimino-5-aminoimidazole carboxamide ribotide isomerase
LQGAPFAGTVITDISRDGTLKGPDLDGYLYAIGVTRLDVIASGGIGTLGDLLALKGMRVDGKSLAGVIIGRALLSGAFTVGEAVSACAP